MTDEQSNISQPDDELVIRDLEAMKVYFDPMRTRIMQEMAHHPRTVQQIAEALNVPFTRLYYHIKMLEKHNLIRMVDVKRMPGAIEEKYYQVTARLYVIDRALLTFDPESNNDSLEFILQNVFDETHSDIRKSLRAGRIDMSVTPPHPKSILARRVVARLPENQVVQFHQELLDLLKRYRSVDSSSEDAYYGVTVALYPSNMPYEESDDEGELEDIT